MISNSQSPNLSICFLLMISSLSIYNAIPAVESTTEAEALLLQNTGIGTEDQQAKIHFYIHEFSDGPNQSIYDVARASVTANSNSSFGLVQVLDNIFTTAPVIDSPRLGRVQGHVSFSDFQQTSLTMYLSIIFQSGIYNGSTLYIIGRNPIADAVREFAVVGGTGVFRCARGYIFSSTHFRDEHRIVLEYTVYTTYDATAYNERLQAAADI